METITIQCGHCRQVMAISTAHMGMPAHCPHCRQIVQLPAEEAGYQPPAGEAAARLQGSPDSMRYPILLIFLIPYAVIATGFFAFLIYQSRRNDPLIQDNHNPPIRIKHDAPVPRRQKIKLNDAIVVGDLEVVPQKVEITPEGELALHLKMRNKSSDLRFNPMPQTFLDFNPNIMTSPKPYTFLQTTSHFRFYGGNLDYWQGQPGQGQKSDGTLNPGQEMTTLLHTKNDVTSLQEVKRVKQAGGKLLWRIQVRRGLMSVRGKDVSVTTVIGIEFDTEQIQPSGRPAS